MTTCFTAICCAAAAALCSEVADRNPRVPYPVSCLVQVGGIDNDLKSIDSYITPKVTPREGTRPTTPCRPGLLTRRRGFMSSCIVSEHNPHEARRNRAFFPRSSDYRWGGANFDTRLGNLTGEGSALAGATVVPEPGETALLLLGLCLIVFEFHCRRRAARKRELEQERDGERSGVSPRFPHPSR